MIHDNLFITQCPYCSGDGWDVDNGEPVTCSWCDSGKSRRLEQLLTQLDKIEHLINVEYAIPYEMGLPLPTLIRDILKVIQTK